MPDSPAIAVRSATVTFGGMATESKKRGPMTGYVRMTFDMKADERARLKECAARASRAQGKTVTMGQLLEQWASDGMDTLERRLAHPPKPVEPVKPRPRVKRK